MELSLWINDRGWWNWCLQQKLKSNQEKELLGKLSSVDWRSLEECKDNGERQSSLLERGTSGLEAREGVNGLPKRGTRGLGAREGVNGRRGCEHRLLKACNFRMRWGNQWWGDQQRELNLGLWGVAEWKEEVARADQSLGGEGSNQGDRAGRL